jgi:hypothetical protein
MLRKRIVEFALPASDDLSLAAQVERELDWYNGTRYGHLTVYLAVTQDDERTRGAIQSVITEFRERKNSQKSDPNFKILASPPLSDDFIAFITGLDCRLPRLSLMPHFSDANGFGGLVASMRTVATTLRKHIIDYRFSITAERPVETFPELSQELRRLSTGEPADKALLEKFPVIEVPFMTGGDEPTRLADCVALLWSQWPQLNDAVNLSRGGYMKHFYALKELWHLGKITRQPSIDKDLDELRTSYRAGEAIEARIATFDGVFLERYASLHHYSEWRHRSENVVLEFDLDSIADTYECQSPVFIDNKWILESQSLRAEKDEQREN